MYREGLSSWLGIYRVCPQFVAVECLDNSVPCRHTVFHMYLRLCVYEHLIPCVPYSLSYTSALPSFASRNHLTLIFGCTSLNARPTRSCCTRCTPCHLAGFPTFFNIHTFSRTPALHAILRISTCSVIRLRYLVHHLLNTVTPVYSTSYTHT